LSRTHWTKRALGLLGLIRFSSVFVELAGAASHPRGAAFANALPTNVKGSIRRLSSRGRVRFGPFRGASASSSATPPRGAGRATISPSASCWRRWSWPRAARAAFSTGEPTDAVVAHAGRLAGRVRLPHRLAGAGRLAGAAARAATSIRCSPPSSRWCAGAASSPRPRRHRPRRRWPRPGCAARASTRRWPPATSSSSFAKARCRRPARQDPAEAEGSGSPPSGLTQPREIERASSWRRHGGEPRSDRTPLTAKGQMQRERDASPCKSRQRGCDPGLGQARTPLDAPLAQVRRRQRWRRRGGGIAVPEKPSETEGRGRGQRERGLPSEK